MKMQGVLASNCKINVQKHFAKPDLRAEEREREYEEHMKMLQKEAKT